MSIAPTASPLLTFTVEGVQSTIFSGHFARAEISPVELLLDVTELSLGLILHTLL